MEEGKQGGAFRLLKGMHRIGAAQRLKLILRLKTNLALIFNCPSKPSFQWPR